MCGECGHNLRTCLLMAPIKQKKCINCSKRLTDRAYWCTFCKGYTCGEYIAKCCYRLPSDNDAARAENRHKRVKAWEMLTVPAVRLVLSLAKMKQLSFENMRNLEDVASAGALTSTLAESVQVLARLGA